MSNYRKSDDFNKLSEKAKRRRIVDDSSSEDRQQSESIDSESDSDELVENTPSDDELPDPIPTFSQASTSVSPSQDLAEALSESDNSVHPSSSQLDVPSNSDPDDSSSSSGVNGDSDFEIPSNDSSISSESDFEDGHDNDEVNDALVVEQQVREWALQYNITNVATSNLLRRLRDCHPECFHSLHIDARSVLQTPSEKVVLEEVAPGQYCHFSIRRHLTYILSLLPITIMSLLLLFNVDGFPLRESTFSETWPISMSFPTFRRFRDLVFPVGIFAGSSKPDDIHQFLRAFVNELKELLAHGFHYKGRVISIDVLGFCCDSPARSYIMGTISHGGFYCCPWCTVQGVSYLNRRIYLETDCPPRTDEDFRTRKDSHFRPPDKSTPLEEIDKIDFSKSFILDPMHLLFSGVMKKLLLTWLGSGIPYKFSVAQRQEFLNDIKRIHIHIPSFFTRKLQAIKINKTKDKVSLKWKAKEFRLFLLYVGPVILKKYLSPSRYNHFLQLHIAIFILYCPKLCANLDLRNYAHQLLVHFVKSTPKVYGAELVVFVFHALIHLVDVVNHFAKFFSNFSLNDLSTFPFENFLRKIKQTARGPAKSLQQIYKRIEERSRCKALDKLYGPGLPPPEEVTFQISHNDGPLLPSCTNPQFKKAISSNFNLSASNEADCFCQVSSGSIVKVENFALSEHGERLVIGRKYTDLTSFYADQLMSSDNFGIFKASKLSELKSWNVSSISAQYMGLPDDKGNIILFPLLHCLT